MTVRSLGIVSLLAALAIGGWLYATQMRTAGRTSETARQAEQQASAAAATASFQAAETALAAYFADRGTYAGATLPPSFGVVVARADATSYCVQSAGGDVRHVAGPGGMATPGPC